MGSGRVAHREQVPPQEWARMCYEFGMVWPKKNSHSRIEIQSLSLASMLCAGPMLQTVQHQTRLRLAIP